MSFSGSVVIIVIKMKQINFKSLVAVVLLASTTVICTASATSNTEKWEIKTSSEKIPEGWEPFGYDCNDKSDPFLLRRKTNNWDNKQKWEIQTSSSLTGKILEGWEPFGYDYKDESDPLLLRRRSSGEWDNKQKWEIQTSSGTIPEGWEPFAYDSNDKSDPFLLRRRIK